MRLTNEHIDAMRQVVGGVDVFDKYLATLLREAEQMAPDLIKICDPINPYAPQDELPYLGAWITRVGAYYLSKHD